jgi:apolipoprotein N-acyltransferase
MISDRLKKFAGFAWFLPGFLLWAAFPPMGEVADCLFALAPLMWLSRRATPGESAKRWFQSGAFFWVATLSWMPAIVKNGGPWPLVVLGWFALAAYCAGFFALYGWLSARYWGWARGRAELAVARSRLPGVWWRLAGVLFVEPVLWCGIELLRSRLFGGFAWNHLGVVPANSGFGAPAAIGGVYLLSAVVVLINGTAAGIAERVWKVERSGFPLLRRLGAIETLLAFAVVLGIYRASSLVGSTRPSREDSAGRHIKVALVQRNFPCVFKEQSANPYEVYGRLLANVAELKPDLVVLAESALAEFGPVDQQGAVRFADFVRRKTGASLLAGGTRFEEGLTYNSAALYRADGAIDMYDKVHLVPFGEFIPGDKVITALQKLAPVGSCTPGELKTVKWIPGPDGEGIGVAICYEDTDSAQMRRLANMGAGLLVFITNDSWFSNSIEAEAHAWQATARAIETGLAVVRVGNNGVTGTISPSGRATWLADASGRPLVDREGAMLDRVALRPALGEDGGWRGYTTPYAACGDIPLGTTFLLLIGAMILVKYRTHYGKHRIMSLQVG